MSKSIFTSSLCRHRLLPLLLPKTATNFYLYFHPTGELGVSLVYYSSVSLTRFWKVWSLTPKGYSDILHRLIHSNFFVNFHFIIIALGITTSSHCFIGISHFLMGTSILKNSSLLLFKKSPSACVKGWSFCIHMQNFKRSSQSLLKHEKRKCFVSVTSNQVQKLWKKSQK